jgi:SIT4-associating protein SAP185/190
MLKGGNPLTVGVGIVIEVIRKNNSDYDPDVGADSNMAPSSRDPIYLGTLLRMFAKHVPDFMALILSPDHTIGGDDGPVTIKRRELSAAFGGKVEPLGFDRFKTCELMAELLHCSNMGLLNERGSEEYVRARDAERERLKAEGKLTVSGDRFNLDSDDLTMKSSNTSRLGSNSPEEMRRLEIQNASDDDGFEEVTHSQDLGDDTKDDFDEKSDVDDDLLANMKPESLHSFLDKDDDEFVDEPLSSPRLNTDVESVESLQPNTAEDSLHVQPLSPTKELSDKVEDLKVNQDESSGNPPSYDDHSKDPTISPEEQIKKTLDEAISAEVQPKAEETVEESPEPTLHIPLGLAAPDDGLSPHPDDHPAPLFAKKKDETLEKEEEAPIPIQIAPQIPIPEDLSLSSSFSVTEIEDSTMVDADGTILLENIDDSKAIENEIEFISPVVGDYLKMQFVEHKVVPTILVGMLDLFWKYWLIFAIRTSFSDFHGITSYITLSMMLYNRSSMGQWTVDITGLLPLIFLIQEISLSGS